MTEPSVSQQLHEPDAARRPSRLALYVGVGLVVAGLAALYLGYNGAATNSIPAAQTPFIISGGLVGLGLLALGGIAIALSVILQIQGDFRSELNALRESVEQLSDAISHQVFGTISTPAQSSNGHVVVARGATSFHRPECRLVVGGEHVRPIPREEADRSGLSPCRICKP